MKRASVLSLIALTLLLISACASSPFKLEGVNRSLSPALANAGPENQGKTAIWGGLIIQSRNFKDRSEIEVLSFPLDSGGEPNRSGPAQGRFIIQQDGFLETAQYAAGRWVSALGSVQPSMKGQVGSSDYTFAVIRAQQLHLWTESTGSSSPNTSVHFGIGIGISR